MLFVLPPLNVSGEGKVTDKIRCYVTGTNSTASLHGVTYMFMYIYFGKSRKIIWYLSY